MLNYDFNFEDEDQDEDYEESDFELYQNKENFQSFFPDKLYGKEGKYFFPGTIDEACLLVTQLPLAKNQ